MRVKHRYAFNSDEKAVMRFLNKHKIKYEKDETTIILYLYEDDANYEFVSKFLNTQGAVDIPEAVYTLEEIERAKWLTVRSSWLSQYPQPEKDWEYMHTTYDATNYCEGNKPMHYCGKGLVQKEPFVIRKAPNWGSRNFMMLNWVWDELFISKKAEEVLMSSNLKGFEIYDVFNKSKKPFEEIKQIYVKNYLAEGICANSIKRKIVCPKCNFVKYMSKPGYNCFHKEIFEDIQVDIVKTTDKFGELGCTSLILVTHRFYEVVTNAKLDRGLVFEPVELI